MKQTNNNLIDLYSLRAMILDAFDWDFEYKNGEIENLIEYSGLKVEVEETWIDFGAGWKSKQIVVSYTDQRNGESSFQLLSPRDVIAMKDGGINKSLAEYYVRLVVQHIQAWGNSKDAQIVWNSWKEGK
tara:strand:+ start:759 stop:1145 length:387 start_codon:yes stop_codon:yes gene_type:complete